MVVKMKKYIVFILILGLISSFFIGLYLHKLSNIEEKNAFEAEYTKLETANVIKNAQDILEETSSIQTKTSPNTKIIEKKYYCDCNHLIEEKKEIKETLINKTEAEFKINYIGWEIQKFTTNEIIVYKEIYDYCNQHYILKDVEGEIIVYALDKYDKERETVRETGIETKYLAEIDVENLKKGIKVYSNKELNQLLEDFE